MEAPQTSGLCYTAGMRNRANLLAQGFGITLHAFGFVLGNESALQPFVVRRNAGRAGVLVTLQGLDAA